MQGNLSLLLGGELLWFWNLNELMSELGIVRSLVITNMKTSLMFVSWKVDEVDLGDGKWDANDFILAVAN